MQRERAQIILKNPEGQRVVASAARISTTQGSALEIFEHSGDAAKDMKLIGRVLGSGHKSVLEHQSFSVAFDGVSVLVEQFLIEFRLGSYTVKSRRYVDFSEAGFVIPEGLPKAFLEPYCGRMQALFGIYETLLAHDIPREDARFVLPYCFRSNFYVTANARELVQMICQMAYGRGSQFEEIRSLGLSLADQFEALYPGVLEQERKHFPACAPQPLPKAFAAGCAQRGDAEMISAPADAEAALEAALAFSGRFQPEDGCWLTERNMLALVRDARPRELETLNFTFRIKDVSLAGITHFTRHRMLSLLVPNAATALATGNYVLPESVAAQPEMLALYASAFAGQTELIRELTEQGLPAEYAPYFALAGNTMDILMTINGRELNHFLQLRTCRRAQWEIRGIARRMLALLQDYSDDIFWVFGPSCAVKGHCPEGRLSCGQPETRG